MSTVDITHVNWANQKAPIVQISGLPKQFNRKALQILDYNLESGFAKFQLVKSLGRSSIKGTATVKNCTVRYSTNTIIIPEGPATFHHDPELNIITLRWSVTVGIPERKQIKTLVNELNNLLKANKDMTPVIENGFVRIDRLVMTRYC